MLLKITNQCQMECTHCMENATPTGEHMDSNTFYNATEFIKKIKPDVLLISGGEPLEHPHFFEYTEYLKTIINPRGILITSNGEFLSDENLYQKCCDLGVNFQIMNDKRYYPRRITYTKEQFNHPNFAIIIDDVRGIYPQGRAVKNSINPHPFKSPKCFNLRSIICSGNDLVESVKILESMGKFCTPSVSYNGKIFLGESSLCEPIGDVISDMSIMEEKIKSFKCNHCALVDKLDAFHKKAINLI